jgi:hypothetical protein
MTDVQLGFASLGLAAISLALWIRALRRVAIPENRGLFVATWIAAAGLGAAALLGEAGWLGGVPAALGALVSLVLLFTFSVSRQKLGADAIGVGATVPHFTAVDEHGQPFDSRSLAGHPVLIKFFRAHW